MNNITIVFNSGSDYTYKNVDIEQDFNVIWLTIKNTKENIEYKVNIKSIKFIAIEKIME